MSYERVKYKLQNNDANTELWLSDGTHTNNPAPKNWDTAEKTLKRSTKTYGVYTELSKNLEFTKKGRDFLLQATNLKDIEADVILEEYRRHPHNESWYLHSTGVFDFSNYKYDDITFKVPFKTGGLNTLIQSQLKEKFELQRTESINGKEIQPIKTIDVLLEGRDILLISQLRQKTDNYSIFEGSARIIPELEIVANSDQEHIGAVTGDPVYLPPWTAVSANNCFYFNNLVEKTVRFDLDYRLRANRPGTSQSKYWIILKRYNYNGNDGVFTHIQDYSPYPNSDSGWMDISTTLEGSYSTDIDLSVGDCLMFQWFFDGQGGIASNGQNIREQFFDITVTENSERDESLTQAFFMHEAGEQISKIITGETGRFKSDFYGRVDIGYEQDSEFCRTALTSGFYVRQFYEKNIEMSLDNYFTTSNTIHNTSYGIETINNRECLVVEDLKYFFQDITTIKIENQVSNVVRTPATEFYNSSLLFGYKKGGEYEEAMGLDEYNVRTGYVTNLTRVDTKFKKESSARADSYAKEFARRKLKVNYPEEDTRYDNDLHLMDLKEGLGETFLERKWADDFELEPTGIYSPETATNLRLTPRELNNRHQWFYGASLRKFQDEKVRFSNSDSNSQLQTKKLGEDIQFENGDINVSDLSQSRFYPQWIEFDSEVDFYINEQVYGKTVINGREIPNYYGKVEFINEKQQKEHGYLFELKSSRLGKWKVLKAL